MLRHPRQGAASNPETRGIVFAGFAAFLATFALAGCEVPPRTDFHVCGEVVDEAGQRVGGVKLEISRKQPPLLLPSTTMGFLILALQAQKGGWDDPSDKQPSVFSQKGDPFTHETVNVDGLFNATASGCEVFYLKFTKEGYDTYDLHLTVRENNPHTGGTLSATGQLERLIREDACVQRSTTVKDGLRITLVRQFAPASMIFTGAGFQQTPDGPISVLDLTGVRRKKDRVRVTTVPDEAAAESLPSNGMWFTAPVDPRTGCFTTAPETTPWGTSKIILSKYVLHLTGPGAGLIVYEPIKPACFQPRIDEMREAPSEGYRNLVEIPSDFAGKNDIGRALHDSGCGGVYFFFRTADGKYGKGRLANRWVDPKMTKAEILLNLWLQPDGSRNLGGWPDQ